MKTSFRSCVGGLIGLLTLLLADSLHAADDPKATCYKLISVGTLLDDFKNSRDDVRREAKDWADQHTVTTDADGTMVVVKKDRPSHTWRVNVKQARATSSDTGTNPPGTIDATWTIPPDVWCSDHDVTLTFSSKGVGNIWGGPQVYSRNAERWDQSPGTKVQGSDPFGGVWSGQWSNGFVDYNTGAITLRPKYKGGDEFITLIVRLAANDNAYVLYYYQRVDGPRPLQPPVTGCTKTFGKDWASSTWGRMPIQIDGAKATGTYANRSGQYGPGTFSGTISGNQLAADWKDANGSGTFVLTLADNGCSFTGTHIVSGPGGKSGEGPTGQHEPPVVTLPDPGKSLPAEPCLDPAAQACIQKWLDKAMEIRNRRDTSNSAPGGLWHVGKYGKLLGHGVIAEEPPDNWETLYHSNVYCYIWLTWQQTNQDAAYGGELEPLASFVTTCYASHTGTTPQPPVSGNPPPVGKMTLWAHKRTAQSGELVMLPIWLLKGADVANMNFTAAYNPAIAKPEGDAVKGYLIDNALFTSNAAESGLVRLGFAGTSGISGDGPVVAYIRFRVTGKPGDRTPITLAVTTINNTAGSVLPIDRIDGEILIVGPDGAVPGDCDGDGILTAADAWCALRMSVKLMPEKPNMDMDKDGQVTSRDATLILQKAVGR